METNEPIDVAEASAALAAIRHSRASALWGGYPSWYWLATGAVMAALLYSVNLTGDWSLAITAALAASLVLVTHLGGRARGVCEGWIRGASRSRDVFVLGGPMAVMVLANALVSKFVPWSSIPAAVLEFVLFAGAGLTMGARATRR